MSVPKRVLVLLFNIMLFSLLWVIYLPHQGAWRKAPEWGAAPVEVRAAVLGQLEVFQDGYTRRDGKQLATFMNRVFSRQRPVVLGTMPGEIYVGYEAAAEVIRTDWESWGDCRFRIAESQVSAIGDVAWFATPGAVKFDLSRFLVLPLRLTGVMAKEAGGWKIRQAQFQFDLDLSTLLLVDLLLLIWLATNLVLLSMAIRRRFIRTRQP
jgi:hypothetical protein